MKTQCNPRIYSFKYNNTFLAKSGFPQYDWKISKLPTFPYSEELNVHLVKSRWFLEESLSALRHCRYQIWIRGGRGNGGNCPGPSSPRGPPVMTFICFK